MLWPWLSRCGCRMPKTAGSMSGRFGSIASPPIIRVGKHKARPFDSVLGLTAADAPPLIATLRHAAWEQEAAPSRSDEHGDRCTVDFDLEVASKSDRIRSYWIVRSGADFARLTTHGLTKCYAQIIASQPRPGRRCEPSSSSRIRLQLQPPREPCAWAISCVRRCKKVSVHAYDQDCGCFDVRLRSLPTRAEPHTPPLFVGTSLRFRWAAMSRSVNPAARSWRTVRRTCCSFLFCTSLSFL